MKPTIFIVTEKNGIITITREKLEELIDSAYNHGYADGKTWSKYYDEPVVIKPSWRDQWARVDTGTAPVHPYGETTCSTSTKSYNEFKGE